ncbi:MAG TPA: PDZ domain-containing protein [Acidobacteriaceae bacterium]|jgi:tricorn protease|nr:PDZ domain-containing protein [Acidobacteriaceae bacterium]
MRRPQTFSIALLFALLYLLISPLKMLGQSVPQLFRSPSLSDTQIAFRYADDIWTVPRDGGVARRLTSTGNVTGGPFFSPDGRTVAYDARVNGDTDVYTIPANGGVPRRVTYHPGGNGIVGWTPDGHDLLFISMADAVRTYFQMFRIRADGSGLPEQLPLPSAYDGSLSADGTHLAYNPWLQWEGDSWKRYRGGQTQPVWIVDLKTLDRVKVPRDNSNDTYPVWLGDAVYFLSDRNGPVTLFRYDTKTKEVKQLVENHGLDFKTLDGHGNALVYEQFGTIHLYDIASGAEHEVKITTQGDLPALVPHLAKINPKEIQNADISPTGVRAVFEAHGDIFTVPAEKGDVRNLTDTSDAAERNPAWSPDGKRIAYFSDASGEYKLYLRDQDGMKAPQVIDLGPNPTYYYSPAWSPDSKRILYSDKRLNLWYVNVDPSLGPPTPVHVDSDMHEGFGPAGFSASFSPDGKWILYARSLPNFETAAFLYSIDSGKSTQITDGMSNVTNPIFDASGKYIFFTASTDIGPAIDGFGLESLNRTTTASVYVAVLSKDESSPIPPESDDEKSAAEAEKAPAPSEAGKSEEKKNAAVKPVKDETKAAKPALPETKIDLAGIQQRILALPIPARNYVTLEAGKPGVLLLGEGNAAANPSSQPPLLRSVWRFTLKTRKAEDVLHNATTIATSFDGDKVLYQKGPGWFIASEDDLKPAAADGTPGKPLHVDQMEARIDPRSEWRQMFNETWRIEREFFYDPGYHGLNLHKIEARYEPYVSGLTTRSDLTYLQDEMLGEFTVGHMFIHGPQDNDDGPKTGLLGANYTIDHGRYRFAHIVKGGNWNPTMYSPLTQPGVNVHEGEYLLAVNGAPLHATDNLYAAFEGMAGKQTNITVGPNPDGSGSRDVLVVPVPSEREMRMQEWIENNIRRTDELSGGQVAYVYLPDTGGAGFDSFNRYFFAQVEKKAVIIDDRYNQGGDIADYVIDVLKRTPMLNDESRQGLKVTEPTGAIFGPKAMLINQNAGSGGDAMPWLFRQAKLGPLVGERTWGGLVGIGGYPVLIDGGTVTAPRTALYGLTGEFDVENKGVSPDVEVEDDPKSEAAGHDPQLERAVAIVMEELKKNPPQQFAVPPYPNYHKSDGLGGR